MHNLIKNDLHTEEKFLARIEAKDRGFNFGGVYDEVKDYFLITDAFDNSRKVKIVF